MMKAKLQRFIYGLGLLCLSLAFALVTQEVEAKTPHQAGHEKARGDKHQRHHRHHRHRDFWRWGLGLSLTYPLWSSGSRYWDDSYYFPYGYRQPDWIVSPPPVISPPVRLVQPNEPPNVTTHTEVSQAIKSLPANARVIQRDGHTVYQWQGVEYRYDWQTQSYQVVSKVDKTQP